MQFQSYHCELGISNLLFQRIFSNIEIERTTSKNEKQWVKVPCVNAQRSRILKSFESPERKAGLKLPMISYSRTGYTRAPERLNNLHNEVKFEITSVRRNQNLMTPVPIDISYDLTVYAKYQADIDKIASNFMVFFNNDIYVSQEHPVFEGVKLNNQVTMQDNVSEEHPDEFDGSQDDLITSTFQFTFKTYLFAGTKQYKKKNLTVTSSVVSTFISSYIYEFKNDQEVLQYLSVENHNKLSTMLQQEVTTEVTTEISTDIESYDDDIPKINQIDFGFYDVPTFEDILEFIVSVDSEQIVKHEHYTESTYISSEQYIPIIEPGKDDEGNPISVYRGLSSFNDSYDYVDNWCTLAPYVDRLRWKIDETSTKPFPYNVGWVRCGDQTSSDSVKILNS